MMTCDCANHTNGFANLGNGDHHWWVCASCGKPTAEWLKKQEDEMTLLNLFRGGPVDGYAWETTVLMSQAALNVPIHEYRWTPEIVVSAKTGNKARVWVHKGSASTPEAPAAPQEQFVTPEAATTGDTSYMTRRRALGISREEFSQRSGVSFSQMERIERGQKIKPGTKEAVDKLLAELEGSQLPSQ